MHQQIRTRVGKSSVSDGVGAQDVTPIVSGNVDLESNGIQDLLNLLAQEGYSVCLAAGKGLTAAGPVVLAVEHDEDDEETTRRARDLIEDAGYWKPEIWRPEFEWVQQRNGGLRDALDAIRDRTGKRIVEFHVGQLKDGRAFVHAVVG